MNEYSRILSCIVGNFDYTPFPKNINNIDITFKHFYYDNIFPLIKETLKLSANLTLQDIKYIEPQIQAERKEDVDNLATILKEMGVIVYRPNKFTSCEISSPNWTSVNFPAGNVRDNIFIYNNMIIETSPHMRGRIFENELLYDILYEYLNKGFTWCKLPQCELKDENIDQSWYGGNSASKPRCIFDAAQCLKFDEGIVANYANKNHLIGITCLERLLGRTIYKINVTDNHIDGMIIPIGRKTILVNPKLNCSKLPSFLSNYDKIVVTDKEISNGICLASENILINCLASDNKVIINKNAVNTIKELEQHHFEVIPIQFRHSRIYSGGIHCSTLDLERSQNGFI